MFKEKFCIVSEGNTLWTGVISILTGLACAGCKGGSDLSGAPGPLLRHAIRY